jgi:hypothetical protein
VIDPKALSDEQQALWRELKVGTPTPSGTQTHDQALNAQEAAFRSACALEGIPLTDTPASPNGASAPAAPVPSANG